MILEKTKVISYKDLVVKRAEREAREHDKVEGKRKHDRKRKSQQEASAPKPKAKDVRLSEAQVKEDGIAPEPWRAPMAKMW